MRDMTTEEKQSKAICKDCIHSFEDVYWEDQTLFCKLCIPPSVYNYVDGTVIDSMPESAICQRHNGDGKCLSYSPY